MSSIKSRSSSKVGGPGDTDQTGSKESELPDIYESHGRARVDTEDTDTGEGGDHLGGRSQEQEQE